MQFLLGQDHCTSFVRSNVFPHPEILHVHEVHGAFTNEAIHTSLNAGGAIVKHTVWERGENVTQAFPDTLRPQGEGFDPLAKGLHFPALFHEIEFRSFGEMDKPDPVSRGQVTDELIDALRASQRPGVDQIRRKKQDVNCRSP